MQKIQKNVINLNPLDVDLIAEKLGGRVIYATDDFFAPKENLLKESEPIFIKDKFTENGKWMDGWESRRKRGPGNDWVIISLPVLGKIDVFDIDTSFFVGNFPSFASVEGIRIDRSLTIEEMASKDELDWFTLLKKRELRPDALHTFEVANHSPVNYLRLQIYPDGGIARFRAYGRVEKDWSLVGDKEEVELSSAINGGRTVACNDMYFSPMRHLLLPERGINMGDGWESKRSRIPNNCDWVILKLGIKGNVHRVIVDTNHFKGNYPDTCSIEGAITDNVSIDKFQSIDWQPILPKVKLNPHMEHMFNDALLNEGPFTHIRLRIYPDGGVSRLRIFGTKAE